MASSLETEQQSAHEAFPRHEEAECMCLPLAVLNPIGKLDPIYVYLSLRCKEVVTVFILLVWHTDLSCERTICVSMSSILQLVDSTSIYVKHEVQ